MNMFEEARALGVTMKMCNMSQSEMAKRLGVSQSYVANKLRLLGHTEDMQKRICESGISERHARALLRLTDEKKRNEALEKIISGKLTVKDSEALIEVLHDQDAPRLIRSDRAHSVELFKSALKSSVATLVSLGIDAHKSESYYGRKTYITICIEEP